MLLKLNANVCNPNQTSCSVMAHRPQRSLTVELSLCEPDHMVTLLILKIYVVEQCHVKIIKITSAFVGWNVFKQGLFVFISLGFEISCFTASLKEGIASSECSPSVFLHLTLLLVIVLQLDSRCFDPLVFLSSSAQH